MRAPLLRQVLRAGQRPRLGDVGPPRGAALHHGSRLMLGSRLGSCPRGPVLDIYQHAGPRSSSLCPLRLIIQVGPPPSSSLSPTSLSYLILCRLWHWLTASPPNSCHHLGATASGRAQYPGLAGSPSLHSVSWAACACSLPRRVNAPEPWRAAAAGSYALLGLPAPGLPPARDSFPPAVLWLPWVCNPVPQCGWLLLCCSGLHFLDEAVEA